MILYVESLKEFIKYKNDYMNLAWSKYDTGSISKSITLHILVLYQLDK